MKPQLILYWARRDLRLQDNPALSKAMDHANKEHIPFAPLFILEDYMLKAEVHSQFGYPQRLFLSKALPQFIQKFPTFHIITGKAAQSIIEISHHYTVHLYLNQDIHPDFNTQLAKIKQANITIHLYKDTLTITPNIQTQTGNIYGVFTPFKKAVWNEFVTTKLYPLANTQLPTYHTEPLSPKLSYIDVTEENIWEAMSHKRSLIIDNTIYDLDILTPLPDLSPWYFSEKEALLRFQSYLNTTLPLYHQTRDSLGQDGTSKMSLALAWGLVSARTLCHLIQDYLQTDLGDINNPHLGANTYISELIWREFYHYLLFHYSHLLDTEFQPKFHHIQWESGNIAHTRFLSWIQGKTGYHIVDAAMQQIAQTGWMHNRTRMIVASILTKHLGIDWRWGQEYFRAALIDLDDASNNGGWQWAASVGADPKPIRIFNPYLQAEKYDPESVYQRKWLPHDYNYDISPIIEHTIARKEALERYNSIKK